LKEDIASAASDWFEIHIQGKGGHGAMPESSVDPINVACHIHTAIQSINGREIGVDDASVFTIGKIEAGTTSNIIPDTAHMYGTIRTFSKEMRKFIPSRIADISEFTAKAFRANAEFKLIEGCPSVLNDKDLLNSIRNSVLDIIGEDMICNMKDFTPSGRLPGSEDFGYVTEKVPGAMLVLAAGDPSEGYVYPVHHPKATFDESALVNGTAVYVYSAMKWLEENV
ncbi:MAG: M20 metallopeptidase family protein, partial [Paraclostridium sp.]